MMADVKKIATRESCGKALAALGAEHEDILVLDADLAGATKSGIFKKAFPDRLFRVDAVQKDQAAFSVSGHKTRKDLGHH